MAHLDESSDIWPVGIRQIETDDPVLGGVPNEAGGTGIPNISLQQLAIRTKLLKAMIEGITIPNATTTVAGIVKLVTSVTSTSETAAATPHSAKMANDNANTRLAKTSNLSDLTNAGTARANLGLGSMAIRNHGTDLYEHRTNTQNDDRFARRSMNLSDLDSDIQARANLGLGTMATLNAGTDWDQYRTNSQNDGRFAQRANNLSDLLNVATARSNLGLGSMATRNYGTSSDTHRTNAENDARFLKVASDLADLASAINARTNLGLGSMAIRNHGTDLYEHRTNTQNDDRFAQRANNLSDLLNVATARTNLDVAQRQSSTEDTTSGRGAIIGAFGLGADQTPFLGDLDGIGRTGWAKSWSSTSNTPASQIAAVFHAQHATDSAAQLALGVANDRAFFRGKASGGAFRSWLEFYHTGNVGSIPRFGVGQTWTDVVGSRAIGTSYQNTTGLPIMLSIAAFHENVIPDPGGSAPPGYSPPTLQVSTNGSSWVTVSDVGFTNADWMTAVVPPGHYYRVIGSGTLSEWVELR